MKKIQITLMSLLLLAVLFPGSASASNAIGTASTTAPTSAETAEANTLLLRLEEVNALDKSSMSSAEKKELRREVKSIKARLRDIGGGVYISVGAVIIILLLLIILL